MESNPTTDDGTVNCCGCRVRAVPLEKVRDRLVYIGACSLVTLYRQRIERPSLMQSRVATPHWPVSAVGGSSTKVPLSISAGGAIA